MGFGMWMLFLSILGNINSNELVNIENCDCFIICIYFFYKSIIYKYWYVFGEK